MGLYLCIFEGDEDIDGVDVGYYADFGHLRDYIIRELEEGGSLSGFARFVIRLRDSISGKPGSGSPGSKFPTFILHSDCDGEWPVSDCVILRDELAEIAAALKTRPAVEFESDWQREVAKSIGLEPTNAFESFIDVDGEFLIDRLQSLVDKALDRQLPILFQ